jgi:DNA polymerase III subunit beta
MKLQVTQENLHKALSAVARVASGRSTLPILSNILLKTVNNRLSISATNLDIAITQLVGSKISKEGSITVPARLMQDFIASLPSGIIDLQLEDNKLLIKTDKYQSTINGISAEDYPVMPALSAKNKIEIDTQVLKKALQQVVFTASNDDARPVLTGVYFNSFEGDIYIVATDSYRLAEKKLMTSKDSIQLLLPASSINDLLRVMSDVGDKIQVNYDDQQVQFTIGDVELVTRLIDGVYPDYRKLIPKDFAISATLDKAEFINITKVSSLFARESAGSITLHIDEDTNQLKIQSIASQVGENTAVAAAKVVGSGTITLNSRYLLDALNAIEEDSVTFSFNGKLTPSLLKGVGSKNYQHIIMPLKS